MDNPITPLQACVYEIIERAANKGQLCPTETEMCDLAKCQPSSPNTAIAALQRKGYIKVITQKHGLSRLRIFQIVRTGLMTAEPKGWWHDNTSVPDTHTRAPVPCWHCGSRIEACECGRAK